MGWEIKIIWWIAERKAFLSHLLSFSHALSAANIDEHELKTIFDRRKCANVSIQQEIWKSFAAGIREWKTSVESWKKNYRWILFDKNTQTDSRFLFPSHVIRMIWSENQTSKLNEIVENCIYFSICFRNNETSINYFFRTYARCRLISYFFCFSKEFGSRGEENE